MGGKAIELLIRQLFNKLHNCLDYSAVRVIIVNMERVQKQHILKDLDKKMVFVAGPRQAGKTWLA